MGTKRALLIVDMQNDFCEGGPLAVAGARALVPRIQHVRAKYAEFFNGGVYATQDWHPANHSSFAASHDGRQPFEEADLGFGNQTLWPVHCVQNTEGASLVDGIDMEGVPVVRKGTDVRYDSYSGFADNAFKKETEMKDILRRHGVTHLFICGVATEVCVKFTAMDSIKNGFETTVLEDLTAPLSQEGASLAKHELEQAGVAHIMSSHLSALAGQT